MIQLTTLYDDINDRPKVTEQKDPFYYIFPPPTKVGRNNKQFHNLKIKMYVPLVKALSRFSTQTINSANCDFKKIFGWLCQ